MRSHQHSSHDMRQYVVENLLERSQYAPRLIHRRWPLTIRKSSLSQLQKEALNLRRVIAIQCDTQILDDALNGIRIELCGMSSQYNARRGLFEQSTQICNAVVTQRRFKQMRNAAGRSHVVSAGEGCVLQSIE